MEKTKRKLRAERMKRPIYAAVYAGAAIIIAWRVAGLLISAPADAAIIMGCVAVMALVRLDVLTMDRAKEERR